MHMFSINNTNYGYKNKLPSFKAYSTRAFNQDGSVAYRTLSNFYRADLNWGNFIDFIINKYKNVDKVNIVNHACSVGYEPYSFLMLLMNKLGKRNCAKFLPIKARDIDSDVIKYAQKGKLEATLGELGMAEHYGGHFESKFYDKDIFDSCCNVSRLEKPISYEDLKEEHIKNEFLISFKPELKNCIDFQQSDIFKDKDLISPDNTILLFRNVWKYLGENGIDKLSDFLAKYMKKSSLLVIGEWDIQNNIAEVLTRKGFKDTLYHRYSEKQIFEAPGAN